MGDPNVGPKLPGMLRQAGAAGVQAHVVQPTHMEGDGKRMAALTMGTIASAVVTEGLGVKRNTVDLGIRTH